MKIAGRWVSGITLAGTLVFATVGCGDSTPPPKGAGDKIHDAQNAMDNGDSLFAKKDYDAAKNCYMNAKAAIDEGRSQARESEMSSIKRLADEIQEKIDTAELKAITDKKKEVQPIVAEAKKLDEAEAKQKAAEKAKADAEAKKNAAKQAELDNALTRKDVGGSKKGDDAPAGEAPKTADASGGDKKPAGKDGDPQAAGGEDAKPESNVVVPARAPYKDITTKSPEIQIVKIDKKGTFVYAYFYVYNNTEDDKRVNIINGFFKDSDNQTIIDHTTTFPFEGFKTDTHKDMIGEQVIDAITLGSDVVLGLKARRYVVVGEHPTRAKDVKKVSVQVVFDNAKALVETGP